MSQRKILNHDEMMEIISNWRKDQMSIVFTNGCFDLLHLGHIDYLEKARSLGDKLIVGLNTDKSISKIKGPQRPVIDEYARARLIAALEFVDAVVFFNDLTPITLIENIRPTILVKGGDYTIETIVGANLVIQNGGTVHSIPLVEGYSTTGLIASILRMHGTDAATINKMS